MNLRSPAPFRGPLARIPRINILRARRLGLWAARLAGSLAVAGALLALGGQTGAPQPPAQQPQSSGQAQPTQSKQNAATSIVKNVNEVNVVFSAVDKHNRIITGLRQDQIKVLDANKQQAITHFFTEGDLPLRIALVIDTSTSVRGRFKFEQEAAIEFIESVLRQGTDQAMVVAFDSSIQVVQNFTGDEEALAKAINSLRAGGGTALYDAIYTTAHDKLLRDGNEIRNVMVVISDGDDDQSRYSASEALAMAQQAGAILYTISTDQTGSDPKDDQLMKEFADATGGRGFFPFEAPELGHIFAAITNELRHQYVVSYEPNDLVPNGSFHPIVVKISVKNVIARARRGYYASQNP